jgi:large subunit ribosomal protein L30e
VIDIDKAIATAIKTGKVSFGTDSAMQNAKTGKGKLIVLASNCPQNLREDIEYYSKLSEMPLITFKGSSLDLASVCEKPFSISALTIREPGDSDILKLTESPKEEESDGGNE